MADVTQVAAAATAKAGDQNAPAPKETVLTGAKPEVGTVGAAADGNLDAKKAAEAAQGAPKTGAPEKYDLKLPENSFLDAAVIEEIAAFSKERGFSNEHAQSILNRENARVEGFVKGQNEALEKQIDTWMTESKADKEIGGEAFAKNAELAHRVVERFGTDAFKKALNESGLGNHPELIRFVHRIGKAMREDQLVIPGASAGGAKKSMAELLYGSPETKER
jgi:hypothetical protein